MRFTSEQVPGSLIDVINYDIHSDQSESSAEYVTSVLGILNRRAR